MPAYLVHRLAGDQVLQKINGKIIEKDDFILGLQGGDLFFGYHSAFFERKSGLMLGGTLHFDKPKAFFEKSMQFIKEYKGDGKDALNSYFCGYITHYCVDKRLHPFVYAHAPNGKIHNRLEFMLDSWVLNDLRGMEAADYDIAREISKKNASSCHRALVPADVQRALWIGGARGCSGSGAKIFCAASQKAGNTRHRLLYAGALHLSFYAKRRKDIPAPQKAVAGLFYAGRI